MEQNILITTSTSLEGYKVTKQLGLVRGITVRSRSIFGNIAGGFMMIFGGKSAIYTQLCEQTREDALQLMMKHGKEMGCNAIINMRYDANEVMNGLTEVLALFLFPVLTDTGLMFTSSDWKKTYSLFLSAPL